MPRGAQEIERRVGVGETSGYPLPGLSADGRGHVEEDPSERRAVLAEIRRPAGLGQRPFTRYRSRN